MAEAPHVQNVQTVERLGDVVYIEIPDYRSEAKRDKTKCLAKRQVGLVAVGQQVRSWLDNKPSAATLSFLPPARSRLHNTTSVDVEAFKLKSSLKHSHKQIDEACLKMGVLMEQSDANDDVASTAASKSEKRCVHFWRIDASDGASSIDGDDRGQQIADSDADDGAGARTDRRPASDQLQITEEVECDDSACSEVFYLNRDECGVAIYEYAPMDPKYWKYDLANSEYGREFLEELPKLEFQNRCQQQLMASCPANFERYMKEEKELDKALILAGVKEYCLENNNEIAEGVPANKPASKSQ